MADGNSPLALVSPELQQEVEQFLFAEAALLDRRAYRDWFNLLASDLRYRMPLRFNREKRERGHEYSQAGESCLFDETKASIDLRIKRLETGMAWAEEPPSRTRHMVTNVRIWPNANGNELSVSSYFHLYRSRLERQVDQFLGEREDVLRRADNPFGFVIAAREIRLDQSTVLANNLSVFF
jgi:3-phenylpropionate/cinnamic acid dioxygenase small subunit